MESVRLPNANPNGNEISIVTIIRVDMNRFVLHRNINPQISNSNIYHVQRNFPMNHAAVLLGAKIAVFSKSCSTPHLVILQKFVEFHQLVLQVKVLKFRQREYLLLGMNIQDMIETTTCRYSSFYLVVIENNYFVLISDFSGIPSLKPT